MNNLAQLCCVVGALLGALPENGRAEKPSTRIPAATDRPNIVLCMTDDQGWGDVSYNGLKKIQTPHLDALAAAGLRFNRFYAQPMCSPARAGVLTGRHPNRMGVFGPGVQLRRQETTLAQTLKSAGYVTGHFGKWHLNGTAGPGKVIVQADPFSPRNFGFDESFSVSNYFETDWTFGHNGIATRVAGDGSDVIVARSLEFMRNAAQRGQPFLTVIWFGSPHAPYKPLPEDLKAAGGSGYYGELVAVDRSVGALRKGLRTLGIANNTVLWYCSDNGGWIDPAHPDASGTNGGLRGRKSEMWEGGIRVPGVVEWPGRIKPAITDVPAGVVDIYPTVLDIVHTTATHQVQPLDGISIVPLLEGKISTRPQPLGFWQYVKRRQDLPGVGGNAGPAAWIDNQYKLLKSGSNRVQLFDLSQDPSEATDLAAAQPERVQRMKGELETWQASVMRSYQGMDYPERRVIQPEKLKRETPKPK